MIQIVCQELINSSEYQKFLETQWLKSNLIPCGVFEALRETKKTHKITNWIPTKLLPVCLSAAMFTIFFSIDLLNFQG